MLEHRLAFDALRNNSLRKLTIDEYTIVCILCCLDADSISTEIQEQLKIGGKLFDFDFDFDCAIDELIDTSMVERDPETGQLTVHSIIRKGFLLDVEAGRTRGTFEIATRAIEMLWPRIHKISMDDQIKAEHSELLPHVYSLWNNFKCLSEDHRLEMGEDNVLRLIRLLNEGAQ